MTRKQSKISRHTKKTGQPEHKQEPSKKSQTTGKDPQRFQMVELLDLYLFLKKKKGKNFDDTFKEINDKHEYICME